LVGSAQVRRKNGVLQHGTLPLYGDLGRITQALAFTHATDRTEAAERLLERATTVECALGRRVSWQEAVEAFPRGFQAALGLSFYHDSPSNLELARAEALTAEKYGSDEWTMRR
jgi:lipoate-protein ligase A